jgi:Leucine-rich repeat (LRR) protein
MKYTLTLILLFYVLINNLSGQTLCSKGINADDAAQLKALYTATDGGNWKKNNNWNDIKTLDWYGVKWRVNQDECRVDSLMLIGNKLSGVLPNDLKFPFLRTLLLSSNDLKGQIPDFDFPALEALFLSYNKFTGTLPTFSKLQNLEILYARYNDGLSGKLPLLDLPKLKELRLEACCFTGKIPAWKLPNLEFLDLNCNKLDSLGNPLILPKLRHLDVSHCKKIAGNLDAFEASKNIRYINITDTKLTLGNENVVLGSLETLISTDNKISTTFPIDKFPNLKVLDITNNNFSGSSLFIEKMQNLEHLLASGNKFTFLDLKNIPPSLKTLDLSENEIGDLDYKIDFTKLSSINVSNNKLTFNGLENILVSPKAKFLYHTQRPIPIFVEYKFQDVAFLYTKMSNPNRKNKYEWDDKNVDKGYNINFILNKNDSLLTPNFSGSYGCRISNPKYPSLIIEAIPKLITTNNIKETGSFSIYPNINNGVFNVHLYAPIMRQLKVRIYDTTGKMIFSDELNQPDSEIPFDLSNTAQKGIYFLEVESSLLRHLKKFVIVK